VQQQLTGEVGKFITFTCQVTFGCHVPKLLKSVDFSRSYLKNKRLMGTFLNTLYHTVHFYENKIKMQKKITSGSQMSTRTVINFFINK